MTELIDRRRVRADVEQLAQRFRQDPQAARVRRRVSTHLVRDVLSESNFTQYDKEFTFRSDESAERAGYGSAPSPLRYFLSGVAFCLQAWTAKAAALLDCPLDRLQIDVEAYMDQAGQYEVEGVPTEPQWLVVEYRTEGPAPDDLILRCVDMGRERCPVSKLVSRAVPLLISVDHNDVRIRDVPTGADGMPATGDPAENPGG